VSFLDDTPLPYEEGGRDGAGDEGVEKVGDREGDEIDADEGTDNGRALLRSFDCTHRLTAAEIQIIREEIDGKDVCVLDQTENTFADENDLLKARTVSGPGALEGEVSGGGIRGGEGKDEVEEGGKEKGGEVKGEEKEEGEGDQHTDAEAEKLKVKAEKKGKREKSERRRSRINRAINCQLSFGNKDIYF
jgi:hypothetical protein